MDVKAGPQGSSKRRNMLSDSSGLRVLVCGLGKVGLPIASYFSVHGHTVYGYDTNTKLVDRLSAGDNPLRWEPAIKLDKIQFVTSIGQVIDRTDIVYIIVPTPLQESNTLRLSSDHVISACREIREYRWHGPIAVGSTLDPRTVFDVFQDQSTMFYTPPLIRLGHVVEDMSGPALTLIGWSQRVADRHELDLVYRLFSISPDLVAWGTKIIIGDYLSMAIAKLAINTTLSVKISWANEIAAVVRSLGGSVSTVFEALHADPRIGPDYNFAGWIASGPCLHRDMNVWSDFAKVNHISVASIDSNSETRHRFLSQVLNTVKSVHNPRVAILGITYNPGALDLTKSKGLEIAKVLMAEDVDVKIYDPAGAWEGFSSILENYPVVTTVAEALEDTNIVVKATDWPEFRDMDLGARVVIDVAGKRS